MHQTIENVKHNESEWETKSIQKQTLSGICYIAKKLKGILSGTILNIRKVEKDKFIKSEIETLIKLKNCKYVLEYYGYGQDNEYYYIYSEYIENSITLYDMAKNLNFKFQEDDLLKLLSEIVLGLKSIHQHEVIHRDIKAENIIILGNNGSVGSGGNTPFVRFTNFGLLKHYNKADGSKYYSSIGTSTHLAPEIRLKEDLACFKSDIWSLGCTLIEIAGGDLKRVYGDGVPKMLDNNNLTIYLKNIIQRCLIINVKVRFDIDYLYNYINKFNNFNNDQGIQVFNQTVELNSSNYLLLSDSTVGSITINNNIKYLKYPEGFNDKIDCDVIPPSVEYLYLGDEFDIQDNGEDIPTDTILTLRCGYQFKRPINSRFLPHSITDLQLHNYNVPLNKNSIPPSVLSLTLGNSLPSNAIESLTNLPEGIINLSFGTSSVSVDSIKKLIKPTTTSLKVNGIQIPLESY